MIEERPLPRIDAVAPGADRRLQVRWSTGLTETVDVGPALASRKIFAEVARDAALFRQVLVGEERNHITWGGDANLTAIWIERLAIEQNGQAALGERLS